MYVAARTGRAVQQTVAELQAECMRPHQVAGLECDVARPSSVARLVSRAQSHFEDGCVDVWINNAGASPMPPSRLGAPTGVRTAPASICL